jgi:hypothetical protein
MKLSENLLERGILYASRETSIGVPFYTDYPGKDTKGVHNTKQESWGVS